ncbi:hypothetical protein SAMN06297251_10644 [Fulvimarina manganoxydans]|uniref:Uncharacterized protein n=2 Tax=Fulvimarina manganoxydans TaxID=937218 RepID=A0A1W2BC72_9HYPH|nr:hypothetical protein SAMN06297251_10644 [Fulvimarina manganoxydans]
MDRQPQCPMPGGKGGGMNRRSFLATTAAAGISASLVSTADAECDPLLSLINEYRDQMALFNAAGDLSDEDDAALMAATWEPAYDRLCYDPPAPTTDAGAIAAIRLIVNEAETCGYQPDMIFNVLSVAAAYLERRAAS